MFGGTILLSGYYLSDKDFVNGRLEAPWPTSCKLCPGGQYNVALGQSSCTECVGGKLSNAERSGCEDCEAGQYTSNFACNDCEWGKYAPTAQKDSCLTCFAGDYVNRKLKSTSCLPCDAGSFSTDLSRNCTLCPVGTLSVRYSRFSAILILRPVRIHPRILLDVFMGSVFFFVSSFMRSFALDSTSVS